MAVSFEDLLRNWEKIGVFDVILPFLLVFTFSFAILQKSGIFGENKKGINGVVSFILALLFVRNENLIKLLQRFLPNVSMFMLIILLLLMVIGTFGISTHVGGNKNLAIVAVIVSILFVIWALSADVLNIGNINIRLNDQAKATILFLAVFVIITFFVTRGSSGGQK